MAAGLLGTYLGFTQHFISDLHRMWNTSLSLHVSLHLPVLPQHFMTKSKGQGGSRVNVERKPRTNLKLLQKKSSRGNKEGLWGSSCHKEASEFCGAYQSLSLLPPLVSPVTNPKVSDRGSTRQLPLGEERTTFSSGFHLLM